MQFSINYNGEPMRRSLKSWNAIIRTCLGSLVCLAFYFNLISPRAFAEERARLYSVEGSVEGRIAPSTDWKVIPTNTVFQDGDAIRTGDASRAAILGSDGMMLRLSSNALLEFKVEAGSKEIKLDSGDAYILSRDPHSAPKVTTSIVSGSIRGTEFAVSVRPKQVTFSVLNGSVDCANSLGSVSLASGEEALTEPGKAPQKRIMVRPFDAVQWALRYPALVSLNDFIPALDKGGEQEKRAAQLLRSGSIQEARRGLEHSQHPAALLFRAALALEAGQVETAKNIQTTVRKSISADSELNRIIVQQEAIVQIVANERDLAEKNVSNLLAADKKNVSALYVRSLVYQSKGQIEEAREDLEQALQLESRNSFLLARAAELEFGSGDARKAQELIDTSLAANPEDADAETIQGFILVARGKTEEGAQAFEKALQHGASASAHLGLGITKFRSGDQEAGRVELQKAVHLDPQVALYRSYLGKAFFENEQEGLAEDELNIAAKLDPLDPTPHLYSAFNYLATYRPVDALGALEEAIARNDNRAVYRSRLLLDKDHATRGTGLGRIFSSIDFTKPAEIEALKSLSEDPTNYEAHFLLKDSLIGPETNTAAISEDVVATLLSPANFSSLLPTASGSATLNEYTSLFERKQSRTGLDVIGQSKDRLIETSEVHYAGGDNYSYLLRHGMTYGNGYRDNDFDRAQTGRLLGQYNVTPEDKILLEGIVTDRELGDTSIGIEPLVNDSDSEFELDDFVARAGYHHSFAEDSHFIAQTIFLNSRLQNSDHSSPQPFAVEIENANGDVELFDDAALFDASSSVRTKGVRGDLQHLWNTENFSLVSGASVVGFTDYQNANKSAAIDQLEIFQDVSLSSEAENDVQAYRGYSYATLKPDRRLRLIGGVNYSALDSSLRNTEPFIQGKNSENEFSPKAGVIVYPNSAFTVRAAYFETLGVSSSRELEGIEPTQVAGLRQVFDDAVGTEAEVASAGVDWKSPKSTYTGFSLFTRQLKSPFALAGDTITVGLDQSIGNRVDSQSVEAYADEQGASAYVNQILSSEWVGSLNYDWTETENDFDQFELDTQRARLGLNYYSPTGWFVFSSGTFRHQERDGFDAPDVSKDEDFFILSAGLGWQLPHRHGSVQLAVRNILDESFSYQPTASDIRVYPGVDVSLGISVNF